MIKQGKQQIKSTRKKHYRNSLRLFLVFLAGLLLYSMVVFKGVPRFFGYLGGIGMIYSILGFLANAEVIK